MSVRGVEGTFFVLFVNVLCVNLLGRLPWGDGAFEEKRVVPYIEFAWRGGYTFSRLFLFLCAS